MGSFVFIFAGAYPWTNSHWGHLAVCVFSVTSGILLYLLFVMIIVDIIQLFTHWPAWLFGTIVAMLTSIICIGSIINASHPRIRTTSIELPQLRQNIRAVHITDTHLGHFRGKKHVQKLVNIINQANPEVVFFTGDCFESRYNMNQETLEPLRQIKAPIYFVVGNHDGYVGLDSVKQLMRQTGIQVLENESTEFGGMQIVGLDYMKADEEDANSMHTPTGKVTIKNFCETFSPSDSMPVILLHHNPCGGEYLEKAGVDLYLAGHTHGGQLIPLTWINNRLFQFNKGLYRFGNMQVYTSCGSGTFGPPMRLGTPSEITVLELQASSYN